MMVCLHVRSCHTCSPHCDTLWHTTRHCKILKHTVMYCNKLQHTATTWTTVTLCVGPRSKQQHATHCNTLQHAATRCNTLQHAATYYNALQHLGWQWLWAWGLAALQHAATRCHTLQHAAARCNTLNDSDFAREAPQHRACLTSTHPTSFCHACHHLLMSKKT